MIVDLSDASVFQSAPRSLDRGDPRNHDQDQHGKSVSIRAPVTRPGRRGGALVPSGCRLSFQSAPRSLDRGDGRAGELCWPSSCFNPRPGHSTGATVASWPFADACSHMFQSAPRSLDRGDTAHRAFTDCNRRFQSAPRSLDRGDERQCLGRPLTLDLFQSAPRSLDRGDLSAHWANTFYSPFQSAPRSLDRGDSQHPPDVGACLRFNPRPGHSTGATRDTFDRRTAVRVFQSAPRSLDRGDSDLAKWPSRKHFVTHFRQPASFSRWQFDLDVKEQGKSCAIIAVLLSREAAACQPSL